ncbi:hypothetical protein SteCoe_10939 [Stentor coeruleus]|uniref:TmcB/TmcC TPR repeats domain-containing protein n=1 Tax=Stentor coeruleus TaxID=5963 RepID=A0A1R2CE97_9CILI|nr:hypothetical protein SteCoe_10939 [Stentor coeruleus]
MILAQNIQMFWYFDMPIQNWDKYKVFWNIISLPSIDLIAAEYQVISHFFLGVMIFIYSILAGLALILILLYFEKKVPQIFTMAIRLFITIACEILFIPIVIVLLLGVKYSNSSLEYFSEYEKANKTDGIRLGNLGEFFCALAVVLLVIFGVFYEACSYEIRHVNDGILNDGRIQAKPEVVNKVVHFCNCVLYVSIGLMNYEVMLILMFLLYCIPSVYIVISLHCYSRLLNTVKAFICIDCALICLFFWIGYRIDDAQVTLILTLIFQIVLIPIVKEIVDYRARQIKPLSQVLYLKFEVFERSIRPLLINGTYKETLIEKMNRNFITHREKLNRISQAYYANDVLGNCSLGLNKIFAISHSGLNIVTNYQVFRCKKFLKTICETRSESFKLYRYFLDFSKIKDTDRNFCELYHKFFINMLDHHPELPKLKSLITEVIKDLYFLETSYSSLLMRFPNSNEVKQNYGSFMLNIICDKERGNRLISRVDTLGGRKKNTIKNTLKFISDRCFLVISGNPSTLGKLLFFNQNLANYLGYSYDTIKTLNISHFLPKHLASKHDMYLKRFLENSISHVAFKNSALCLVDSQGYLCECNANCEVIGYENSVNFICAIDPLGFRIRHFCLINEYGYIHGHSKYFATVIFSKLKYIEGHFIQEFFIDLDIKNIQYDEITSHIIKGQINNIQIIKKIYVMLKESKIKSSILIFLYITEDENEVCRWGSTNDFYDMENINPNDNKIETILTEGIDEYRESTLKKKVSIFDEKKLSFDGLSDNGLINDRSKQNNAIKSSYLSMNDVVTIAKSTQVLKIAKIVLLMSIVILIITNIVILIYISKEVEHSNSLTALTNLGDLGYYLSQIALIVRSLDLGTKINIPAFYNTIDLENMISNLISSQTKLLDDFKSWSYCKDSEVVKNNVIPYSVYENMVKTKYGSLHAITGMFIEKSELILIKLRANNTNYENELFFIIFNAFGSSFEHIYQAIIGLKNCEIARVDELSSVNNSLMFAGVGILAVAFTFITVYLLTIDVYLNNLWETLHKRVMSGFIEVKLHLTERLAHYHDLVEYSDSEPLQHSAKHQKKVRFRHSLRYLLRFSILFISAAIFYIVSAFVFNESIHKFLYYRPLLTSTLIQRKIKTNELCFFTLENEFQYTNASINKLYPYFSPMQDIHNSIYELVELIESTKITLRNPNIMKFMSADVKGFIYEKYNGTRAFMKLGTFRALSFLMQESLFIVMDNKIDEFYVVDDFFDEVKEYSEATKAISMEVNKDSKNFINLQVSNLIYFTSVFCVMWIGLYVGFYLPYLSNEVNITKYITKLLMIIPNTFEIRNR